jgi:hypothetical protein
LLGNFLPKLLTEGPDHDLLCRGAVAGTLIASLGWPGTARWCWIRISHGSRSGSVSPSGVPVRRLLADQRTGSPDVGCDPCPWSQTLLGQGGGIAGPYPGGSPRAPAAQPTVEVATEPPKYPLAHGSGQALQSDSCPVSPPCPRSLTSRPAEPSRSGLARSPSIGRTLVRSSSISGVRLQPPGSRARRSKQPRRVKPRPAGVGAHAWPEELQL